MVEVDYYELLGVQRNAGEDEIEKACRRMQSQWSKRSSSPDMDVRHEAETKMARLKEARTHLLSGPAARAAYDQALAQGGVKPQAAAPPPPPTPGGQVDWVATARAALAANDYHAAAYAAKEATTLLGGNAESWSLRSRANLGLGRVQDALFEARHAVEIEMNNAMYHFNLGNVYEQVKDWINALKEYQVATQIDPRSFVYPLAQGSVLQQNGLLDEAIDMYRRVFAQHQQAAPVRDYLARALLEKAETIPRVQSQTRYVITRPEEIGPMTALATEALHLSNDPDVQKSAHETLMYLGTQNNKVWSLPTMVSDAPFIWLGGVVGAFILGILVMGASVGFGLILVFGSLVAAGSIAATSQVPQWKANQRKTGSV
ncbi:DnaJ domain-containing protein [Gordonia sp. PP30]|uniref:DnaJ domain-containing protein n=1 Tax=unclassified Gordonia (in: high G+C Gram-positive bacteria) TaxID=2657482 RepID=UPI001FFF7215|nr:tetratricopeptide repeat protein [Gordonia sp. PP30]UQE76560.1 DnaJ domain-containing protein [Gordonia sp. PP30]